MNENSKTKLAVRVVATISIITGVLVLFRYFFGGYDASKGMLVMGIGAVINGIYLFSLAPKLKY